MVEYLLAEHPKLANTPDKAKNETPLFYVLSKHKQSQNTRMSLTDIFLKYADQSSIDLSHKNSDGKACYEAYATDEIVRAQSSDVTEVNEVQCTGASVDLAAQLIEKKANAQRD